MERFCDEIENTELSNEILFQITGTGTFQRFKYLIYRYKIVDDQFCIRQKH